MARFKLLSEIRRSRSFSSPFYSSNRTIHLLSHNFLYASNSFDHSKSRDFRRNYSFLDDPSPLVFSRFFPFRSFSWSSSTSNSETVGDNRVHVLVEGSVNELENLNPGLDGSTVAEQGINGNGWFSPVDVVIALLDGLHDFSGLPWWLVIVTSTLALRVSLLPVLLLQLKKMQKLAELFPKLPPPFPPPLSGKSFKEQFMLFRKERLAIGCPSYLWSFASIAVQAPCFLLWMLSIRRMSLDHHPGFDSGGMLWFDNLTELSHGAMGFVFPTLISGLYFVNVQLSFQTFKGRTLRGILGLLQKYYKLWLQILTIPTFLVGFCIPQGSLVYWLTNSSLTVIQQLLLKPYVRQKMGPRAQSGTSGLVTHKISTEELLPNELLTLGLEHLASGHQDRALKFLRLAAEKDPGLARALTAIGQILLSRNLPTEAVEYFQRAIPKTNEDGLLIAAHLGAGVSLILQGRTPEGMEHLQKIPQFKEPEDPLDKGCYFKGLTTLASALFNEGQKAEAGKYLRMVAAYDPAVNEWIKQCEAEDDR